LRREEGFDHLPAGLLMWHLTPGFSDGAGDTKPGAKAWTIEEA
jgi:hypothetical protein